MVSQLWKPQYLKHHGGLFQLLHTCKELKWDTLLFAKQGQSCGRAHYFCMKYHNSSYHATSSSITEMANRFAGYSHERTNYARIITIGKIIMILKGMSICFPEIPVGENLWSIQIFPEVVSNSLVGVKKFTLLIKYYETSTIIGLNDDKM